MQPLAADMTIRRHNIVDPFEDTERAFVQLGVSPLHCHNIVDPFEDTESSFPMGLQFD